MAVMAKKQQLLVLLFFLSVSPTRVQLCDMDGASVAHRLSAGVNVLPQGRTVRRRRAAANEPDLDMDWMVVEL